jgi:hypothetical protein
MSADAAGMPQIRRQPEPPYEKLIKVIQNRNGARVPREEREQALLDLIHSFRYLIRKIAKDTFDAYAKSLGERFEDWEHDTMTTFLELVVEDYIPIEFGGQAAFGPYIQTKLFFRMKYAGQKIEKQYQRATLIDFSVLEQATGSVVENFLRGAVREAIYQQVTDSSEDLMDSFTDIEIRTMLNEIKDIAQKVLEPRELLVWGKYHFSGEAVRDIGGQLNPPISTSRVNQIVQGARKKIFETLGKRQIGAALKRS